jgi:hypothetical protein
VNDNGDELDDDIQAIVDGTSAILNILFQSPDSHIAMQTMAAATACMLCSVMSSEREAGEEFNMFIEAVQRSVNRAKKENLVVWPEGSSH